jgi:hypothetical protein
MKHRARRLLDRREQCCVGNTLRPQPQKQAGTPFLLCKPHIHHSGFQRFGDLS